MGHVLSEGTGAGGARELHCQPTVARDGTPAGAPILLRCRKWARSAAQNCRAATSRQSGPTGAGTQGCFAFAVPCSGCVRVRCTDAAHLIHCLQRDDVASHAQQTLGAPQRWSARPQRVQSVKARNSRQACQGPAARRRAGAGAHGGVHMVGDAELAAGVQHDRRDGRVVRVAHVGEEVVHHLRARNGMSRSRATLGPHGSQGRRLCANSRRRRAPAAAPPHPAWQSTLSAVSPPSA